MNLIDFAPDEIVSTKVAITMDLLIFDLARFNCCGSFAMTIEVSLWAEALHTGERHRCGSGQFIAVAVDEQHRPIKIWRAL